MNHNIFYSFIFFIFFISISFVGVSSLLFIFSPPLSSSSSPSPSLHLHLHLHLHFISIIIIIITSVPFYCNQLIDHRLCSRLWLFSCFIWEKVVKTIDHKMNWKRWQDDDDYDHGDKMIRKIRLQWCRRLNNKSEVKKSNQKVLGRNSINHQINFTI